MNEGSRDISKLPKWAQDRIKGLERQRETVVEKLNKFCDTQTKSPIFIDDLVCTGEKSGPSEKRQYIQSTKVEVSHSGVYLLIICRDGYIDLSWCDTKYGCKEVAFIPTSHQSARLVDKENMS
jgi:hypothetical protein